MNNRIIGFAPRPVEIGRIRLGKKDASGKPSKLSELRFTTPHKTIAEAIAAKYGGTVQEWKDENKVEFEVLSTSKEIPIALMGDPMSQQFEMWNSGRECLRRCNGVTDSVSGSPCLCEAMREAAKQSGDIADAKKMCKPKTMLKIMLPEIPGFNGFFVLTTTGWNAAKELLGAVDTIQKLVDLSRPVRATLIMVQKRSRKEKTHTWFQPRIVIQESLDDMQGGQALESRSESASLSTRSVATWEESSLDCVNQVFRDKNQKDKLITMANRWLSDQKITPTEFQQLRRAAWHERRDFLELLAGWDLGELTMEEALKDVKTAQSA